MIDKAMPQGQDGHLDHSQKEWLRLMPDGWDGTDYVAENAKLRKLCTALYRCADAGKPCKTCPLYDGDGGCMDEQRMRELGMEADK